MLSSRLYKKIVFFFLVNIFTTLNWVTAVSVAAGTTEEEHIEKCRLAVDGTPCAFPFRLQGKIVYDGDDDGKYWCSTKTNSSGDHVRKNWAHCKEGCDKKPTEAALQTRTIKEGREHCAITLSDSGSNRDTPCAFPFKFKGTFYDGRCTSQGDPDGKFWCSTKTFQRGRRKNQHVPKGGHWGYCQEGCDIMTVEQTTPRPTTTTQSTVTTRKPTEGTSARPSQKPTNCTGSPYCNERFWDINRGIKLREIEEKQGTWGGFNKETEFGDYLPNEFDGSCGTDKKFAYIVGGVDAKWGEFPFIAALGYRNKRNRMFYKCGATMINRRYIITAAHCHSKTDPESQIAEVVLGDHDLSTNPDCAEVTDEETGESTGEKACNNKPVQRFRIRPSDIIVHEGWDHSTLVNEANDIALIRLPKVAYTAKEIPRGVSVMPICLPWGTLKNGNVAEYPKETFTKNKYTVIGWGRTNNFLRDRGDTYEGGAHSNLLQKLTVPFIPVETCKADFKAFSTLTTDRQVCAGGLQGKDSCSGDSGGPLMVRRDIGAKMYLRGIVSFGTKRCGKGYPGVYTNVEHYIPWIKKNMRE